MPTPDPSPVAVLTAGPAHVAPAVDVYRRANRARNLAPTPERLTRVQAKLTEPGAIAVVAVAGDAVVGMAVAEPGRADDGAGEAVPGLCHLSMVFVDPDQWGRRIGRALVDGVLNRAGAAGFDAVALWTGEENIRAQRLYEAAGFTDSGRRLPMSRGGVMVHRVRPLGTLHIGHSSEPQLGR